MITNKILAFLGLVLPKNNRKIVFGSWVGQSFSDNPRYLFEYCLKNTNFELVWIGQPMIADLIPRTRKRVRFARIGSWQAFFHVVTARVAVYNQNFETDIAPLSAGCRIQKVNLWHGIPFKRMGRELPSFDSHDVAGRNKPSRTARLKSRIVNRFCSERALTSVASDDMAMSLQNSFPTLFGTFLPVGTPRNDFLINNRSNGTLQQELRRKYSMILGIPVEKEWILYMPTFRRKTTDSFSFLHTANCAELTELLIRRKSVLIEKVHFRIAETLSSSKSSPSPNIIPISNSESVRIDTQELLFASDILITDYSSCFFDFSLLNRPVIHFVYDYDEYRLNDTGLRFDLEDVAAGPICKTEEDVLRALTLSTEIMLRQRRSKLAALLEYERGHACEKIVEFLMKHSHWK